MALPSTRFVLLDLDGTLVDSVEPMRRWARALCARYELPPGGAEWIIGQWDSYATWQSFVGAAAEHLGYPEAAMEWTDHLLEHYPREFVLEPAAAERLAALRAAGWKLGIVTNGGTSMQAAKINQVRLHDYVDVVCISEAEGVRKPDRAIFARAAEKLGVELGPRGWMVGDTLGADISGGIAAGLRTIWLPDDADLADAAADGGPGPGGPSGPGPQPEHVCGSIVAALDLILGSA